MIIKFDKKAEKNLRKLPMVIIKKLRKQSGILTENPHHPSLRLKKWITQAIGKRGLTIIIVLLLLLRERLYLFLQLVHMMKD